MQPEIHSYETRVLTSHQAHIFKSKFDKEIGTEHETNPASFGFTITCHELTADEVNECRIIEMGV